MKHITLLTLSFLLTCSVYSQYRILVKPNDEVIPLEKGGYAVDIIKSRSHTMPTSCGSNYFKFGYTEEIYPPSSNFGSYHKDALGMWFIAQAEGTLDTLYWYMNDIGNSDSTLSIRIFKSNIYHGQGPGFSPYPPPCLNWGYYIDTNDLDNGITPFRDMATDPQWISTAALTTFDPLGDELWGDGGFNFKVQPKSVNALPLDTLGYKVDLKKGDAFFVTMQINSPNRHLTTEEENRTSMHAWESTEPVSTTDENYPSRLWKFYEHDSGPSNCAGMPSSLIKKGWIARGPFEDDTLYTSAYNWWYSMTLISNYPPIVFHPDILARGRLEGEPIEFRFLKLCSLEDSSRAGTYWVYYSFNNGPYDSLKASVDSDSLLKVVIPPMPVNTIVTWWYRYFGVDSSGYFSPIQSFVVVGLEQNGYKLDTISHYEWIDADSTYTQVSRFFLRPGADPFFDPTDDGTAGPIDIGFSFSFFGKQVRYAWVGVNGGIALTESRTDTMHLNSNSYFTSWTIPGSQLQPNGLPENFITPLWQDFYLFSRPVISPVPSRILYKSDSTLFTVEWNFITWMTQFRLLFDKIDSSISFKYNTLDTSQIAKTSLVGFQADSSRWFHVCKNGKPDVFIPHPSTVFKFTPSIAVNVKEQSIGLPTAFALEQNYPNPFNPSTVIRYSLPVNSWVTLKIYNLLGQEVTTLVDEFQDAGYKSVEWDANRMASGMYFFRIIAQYHNKTKKMLLLR